MQDDLRTTLYRLEEVTLPQESLPPGQYVIVIGEVPAWGFSSASIFAMAVSEDTPTQVLADRFAEWRKEGRVKVEVVL